MISPEVVLSLSPEVLRELVATFGAPKGDVAAAAFRGKLTREAARALRVVARFGTARGRDALVEAGRATKHAGIDAWLRQPSADVAAKLHLAHAAAKGKDKRAITRLFALATLRLERQRAERPAYELVAAANVTLGEAELREAIAGAFGDALVDVLAHEAKDGTRRLAVLVEGPVATDLVRAKREVLRRTHAPVVVDLVELSEGGARFRLTTSIPEHLPRYASALGLSRRASFTLRPLHDMTPESLAKIALPNGVRRVAVVALLWRAPDGTRREIRALDSRATLDPAARLGYVERATLRFDVAGFDRPVDALLQLPHRLEIAEDEAAPLAREAMRAMGLFAPGALADDTHSLAPFIHPEWRWRAVLGDAAFERVVAKGILVQKTLPHVTTEGFRAFGAAYVVREVPGDASLSYAMAEDPSFGAEIVGAEATAAWSLDEAALRESMQRALEASAPSREEEIVHPGILDLGKVSLADGVLRFVYVLAGPAKAWERAVRGACGVKQTPVLLVPKGRSLAPGMLEIELGVNEQLGAESIARVVGRAAVALGVEDQVDGWRLADEELFIDKSTERAWLHGAQLVMLTQKPFRLLQRLAQNPGATIPAKDVGAYVSKGDYPDVAARQAKVRLERQVKESLAAAGWDMAAASSAAAKLVIAEGRRGYRLGVSVKIS